MALSRRTFVRAAVGAAGALVLPSTVGENVEEARRVFALDRTMLRSPTLPGCRPGTVLVSLSSRGVRVPQGWVRVAEDVFWTDQADTPFACVTNRQPIVFPAPTADWGIIDAVVVVEADGTTVEVPLRPRWIPDGDAPAAFASCALDVPGMIGRRGASS